MEIKSIVSSMPYGVIAVNPQKRITLINPLAREYFNIKDADVSGQKFWTLIKYKRINIAIDATLDNKEQHEEDITLSNQKIVRISTTPIKGDGEETFFGALVIIQDITKVKKLEKMRTEFVSNVSHELKTPITSISGFVETLKNGAINNEKVARRFLDIIDIEAARLYSLINDILNLSEIETMKNDTELISIDLYSLVEAVFDVAEYRRKKDSID